MKRKLTLTAVILAAGLPMAVFAQGGYQEPATPTPRAQGTTDGAPATGTGGPTSSPGTTGSGTTGTGTVGGTASDASLFKELDKDKDGQVSKDEAKRSADVQARFKDLDKDGDGKISMTEWNSGTMK